MAFHVITWIAREVFVATFSIAYLRLDEQPNYCCII